MIAVMRKRDAVRRLLIAPALLLIYSIGWVQQPNTNPCELWAGDLSPELSQPWMSPDLPCLELVIEDAAAGELAFTALAAGEDGVLYAARPREGLVFALDDSDGEGLPDTPRVIASGLTQPNGLAYRDGLLYITGGANLYRVTVASGELETLVDDLPSGAGFWTGGVAVGEDGRIYVATGAPCDTCASIDWQGDDGRGAVISFAPDGSDRRIEATGLRQPADLTFHNGELYVLDGAPSTAFDTAYLDEINRVTAGAHFGFPLCVGAANQPLRPEVDCEGMIPAAYPLPTASTPLGISSYSSDAIPALTDTLLVALGGSYNRLALRGYAVIAVRGDLSGERAVLPSNPAPDNPAFAFTVEQMNYRGSGFWPHRPYDVAVSGQGWIYVSVGGGRILSIRPNAPVEGNR